jgi:DNA polymerase-3 subunit alpha
MRLKSNADFVHCHNHTEFSPFDGLNKMIEWVLHARRMGFRSLAISDHGNIGGWIKFYQECRKKKDKNDKEILGADGNPLPTIKPIFGMEAYLARTIKEKNEDGRKGNRHLLLLAKSREGYENLCTLAQMAQVQGRYIDPRIDLENLAKHSKGLICSSACLSSVVNANLLHGRYDQAKRVATLLKDIFNEDFFLEVMYHGIDAEGAIIPEVLKLGQQLGIPVIASNDCHYCKKEQARSQEVLMAMSTSRCLKDPRRIHFPHDEFYLKSAEEMSQIFGSHPEVLFNTNAVADRIEDFLKTGGMRLPRFDVPGAKEGLRLDGIGIEYGEVEGKRYLADIQSRNMEAINEAVLQQGSGDEQFEEAYQFMCDLAEQGMKKLRWDKSEAHIAQLKLELTDVRVAWTANRMDFATYFLIVWDYISFARANEIFTGCGRGSGYASVLLRTLGICYGPDPLLYGLIWERFLSFDWKFYLTDSDWGITDAAEVAVTTDLPIISDDLDEDRAVEDDTGGVDRY